MGAISSIEWTDSSWNPVRARNIKTGRIGHYCQKVSPGCANCYAEKFNQQGRGQVGTKISYVPSALNNNVVLFLDEKTLTEPLRWKKPRKIFVCSMTDAFAEFVPDEWLDRIFAVMALAPRHTFQVLTKRAARLPKYINEATRYRVRKLAESMGMKVQTDPFWITADLFRWPLPNVWLGVSAEDQPRLDERVPELLATPAAVRFLSLEPLLGPIDFNPPAENAYRMLSRWYGPNGFDESGSQPERTRREGMFPRVDWVIVGGESGPGARPMHPEWARSIRDQCQAAGVPYFFKQWGAWSPNAPARWPTMAMKGQAALIDQDGWWERYPVKETERLSNVTTENVYSVGKKAAGRELDGRTWSEFPEAR